MFDRFKFATRLPIFKLVCFFNNAPYRQNEAIKVEFKISLWQEFNIFFSFAIQDTVYSIRIICWLSKKKKRKLHRVSEISLWNLSYFLSAYTDSCNIFFLSFSNNFKDKSCSYTGALEVMQREGKHIYKLGHKTQGSSKAMLWMNT